jgi:hypothetical protein
MQFSIGRPDLVRAINQRWLLKFWKRHLGPLRVPQWQTVEAENLTRLSDSLNFLDVSGAGDNARFQLRIHCAIFAKAYYPTDCRGKYLDEIVRADRQPIALAPYHQAVKCGCPIYTIHDVTDRDGRLVHFERLLLPFSRDGESVDRILASFEFISPDGAFESEGLLTTHPLPSALRLSATIEPQALV